MNPPTLKAVHQPEDLLDEQRHRWVNGERPTIESLLEGTSYADDREIQLDLIYHEIVLREELQLPVVREEFVHRFPHLKSDLDLHFEIHQVLVNEGLIDTNDAHGEESWPESQPDATRVPPSIGEYDIERELGRGGMAIVYLARHRHLRRWVALKTFRGARSLSSREMARIRTEAEAIARLSHSRFIQIFEIGEHEGTPWIALEYADQGTLAQRLQSATYRPESAAELIEALARGLQHAHSRQIIHRDLKPANILFTSQGEPKISDFGLAKVLDDAELSPVDVTRTGETIGTPRYMAPEQASGVTGQIGPWTDVYALGTLLYECLTGRPPFVSTSVVDTLRMISSDDPLPPRRLQPALPRDLETICLHCLQKSPERRYPSAEALADDLRRFRLGEPISARPTPLWERAWKWGRRRPFLAMSLMVAVLLFSGGVSAAVVMQRLKTQRIQDLRTRVAELTHAGRQLIEKEEYESAQSRLQEAWQIIQSEPALADHETSVSGWMDHVHNAINKYHWTQRVPPREFEELRDSAILESALVVPHLQRPIPLVRDSIVHAASLTPPDEAWNAVREQLQLLDLKMQALESSPAEVLSDLDEAQLENGRAEHELRASLLTQAGHPEEAEAELKLASQFPPQAVETAFQAGLEFARKHDFLKAAEQFQSVLDYEPEHFLARLLQGVCCLRLERLPEARIAITAAIAQRPRFHWSYLFRSQVHRAAGDVAAAMKDLEFAMACQPTAPEGYATLVEAAQLCRQDKNTAKARAWLEAAIELLPDEPAAREELKALDGSVP